MARKHAKTHSHGIKQQGAAGRDELKLFQLHRAADRLEKPRGVEPALHEFVHAVVRLGAPHEERGGVDAEAFRA